MDLTKLQKWGIAGALLGLASVGLYLKVQFSKIYKARWFVGGVKNLKIAADKVSFILLYNIDNKSDLSVLVSEQNYDIFINGVFVSKVSNPTDVKIISHGVSSIPLYVNFAPRDIILAGVINLNDLIKDKANIGIKIKGNLSLKAGIINLKKYQFEVEFKLSDLTKKPENKDSEIE